MREIVFFFKYRDTSQVSKLGDTKTRNNPGIDKHG